MDGEINMNPAVVWTIKILEQEINHFERVFKSMDQDGGRYNTTVSVLKERLKQIKEEDITHEIGETTTITSFTSL